MWVWVQCSIYDVDGGGVLRKNIMLGLVALFQLVDDAVAAAVAVAVAAVAVAVAVAAAAAAAAAAADDNHQHQPYLNFHYCCYYYYYYVIGHFPHQHG